MYKNTIEGGSSPSGILVNYEKNKNCNDGYTQETQEELNEMYESIQLRKLFVGNISYNTTSSSLKEYFIKFGEIDEATVPTDIRTKLSKGFGFIIYHYSSSLDMVMQKRPHKIDGRIIEPRRAIRREEADNPAANASTVKMYVGPSGLTKAMLVSYFSKHGNIKETEIPTKGDHCFITFDNFDPVDKCVNMRKHLINGTIVICKKGLTKTALVEADQKYRQRKRRRNQREEREKKDYNMARNGFDPVKEFWRTGQERAPHRKYPSNFGLQGICYDYDLYNVCKVNDDLHCGIKPKRKSKSHRIKSKSIPDFNMPLMDHQYMFYPPPPSKEYFDKYYEYYYGVPPPHSQPIYQSQQKKNAGKFYDSLNKDFILTDDIAANQNTGQPYGQLDTSNSSSGNSSSGAPMAYYDHSQTFGFKN